MLGQNIRLRPVTGLPLTSMNVCLCLLTLACIIHAGEAETGLEDLGPICPPGSSPTLDRKHCQADGSICPHGYRKTPDRHHCEKVICPSGYTVLDYGVRCKETDNLNVWIITTVAIGVAILAGILGFAIWRYKKNKNNADGTRGTLMQA